MSDVWEQLLSSAVVGVERRAFATPLAVGALGDLIGQLDAGDPERALLAAAAAVALFQRTGRLASMDTTPPPDVCEPDVLPADSPEADAKIRMQIVYLHQRVLGHDEALNSPEVDRTYRLFAGIVADAAKRKGIDSQENYSGRQGLLKPVPDPKYTVRAWRAVLTYLLRRHEFLYE